MKKLYNSLKIALWCSIGVFVGDCLFQYYDYKSHPELYEVESAPWYLGIEIYGIITVVIVAVILILMRIIKDKNK